ncbi:MAG: glutathione S-transferase family protein [Rhizobiales bacterium]|nr:glutathione S-transferase family protein [Hyphomicrobiales bacterium]
MSSITLVIGNKIYSSWSLRPWIALTMAGIPFDEEMIWLDQPDTKAKISAHSKAGRVPILRHGKITIWESLAILEYLAETFPEKNLWPKTKAARAMARSICSEMHAGFSSLRNACPMNLRRPRKPVTLSDATKTDIQRIENMWRECRTNFAKGGKFLFGKYCNADSMFAPVVTRFDTFDIQVAKDTRQYMDNVMATSAFKAWKEAALKETSRIEHDEVD